MLGVRLLPFCIGHQLHLKRVASAFVTGGRVSGANLALAVLICSTSYEHGEGIVAGRIGWLKRLWMLACCVLVRGVNLQAAINTFGRYLDAGLEDPKYWKKPAELKESSTPVELLYLRGISNHYHCYSESNIFNMPFLKAKFLFVGWLENEGAVEFGSRHDDEIEKRKVEMLAELMEAAHG